MVNSSSSFYLGIKDQYAGRVWIEQDGGPLEPRHELGEQLKPLVVGEASERWYPIDLIAELTKVDP